MLVEEDKMGPKAHVAEASHRRDEGDDCCLEDCKHRFMGSFHQGAESAMRELVNVIY